MLGYFFNFRFVLSGGANFVLCFGVVGLFCFIFFVFNVGKYIKVLQIIFL